MRWMVTLLGLAAIISAPVYAAPPALAEMPLDAATPTSPLGQLSLREALALTLERNPNLAVSTQEIAARRALVIQAGLRPNPTFGITQDNLGNNALSSGTDGPATTLQFGQLLELGGKRAAREQVASEAQTVAEREADVMRVELMASTTQRFVEVLAAQAQRALATELLTLAESTAAAVKAKVKAGKVFPIEATKADVVLATVRLQRAQTERNLAAARQQLVALWGDEVTEFTAVGELGVLPEVPVYAELEQRLTGSPTLARWAARITERQAQLRLAERKAIPDLTVTGGVRHYNDIGEPVALVGVSIPLQFFDRNQGGRAEAGVRVQQAHDELRVAELEAKSALQAIYAAIISAHAEIEILSTEVLPGAEEVFRVATEAYKAGKFGLLEVLDAQRLLFDTRGRHWQALFTFHSRIAELERLLGGPLAGELGHGK